MIGAAADQRVFEDLVAYRLPEIHHHLQDLMIPLQLISLPWFMCLYIGSLPLNATTRILDVLFSEGREIFFKIGLAVLKMHEQQILQESDSGNLLTFMKSIKDQVDVEKLFKVYFLILSQ